VEYFFYAVAAWFGWVLAPLVMVLGVVAILLIALIVLKAIDGISAAWKKIFH
jgi:hypothetical protein